MASKGKQTYRRRADRSASDLHVCPQCRSELVHPIAWEEVSDRSWRVLLRCPECEHVHEGTYSQAVVDAFDERLDEGTEALATDYRSCVRANLTAELERFAAALAVNAILPEDF